MFVSDKQVVSSSVYTVVWEMSNAKEEEEEAEEVELE